MRHLIVDDAALQQCTEAHSDALEDMRRFCEEHGYQLHFIHQTAERPCIIQDKGDRNSKRRELHANESCDCAELLCIRDAVLSSVDTEDEINLLLKDPRNACLANYADRIFVTGELLRYCTQLNIPHHPVWFWFDCSRILAVHAKQTKEIQRRQARLYRMEASKTE